MLKFGNKLQSGQTGRCATDSTTPLWKILIVWLLRIAVGSVFVVSGFVKMVDLWGFIFKIEDYLAVWHFTQPRTVLLIVAMFISGYEFVLGTLLMFGCYKRAAVWGLLLSIIAFLPLTAYIWLYNPVSDCGCFGDFFRFSNFATFMKNVVLAVLLVIMLFWNRQVHQSLFSPAIQWMVGAWLTLYIIIVGIYGYHVQPFIDFRPYPVGSPLLIDADDDDAQYAFLYEKDGIAKTFAIDNLPDSTWTFVDRVAPSGRLASDAPLAIFDGDEDVTDMVIDTQGRQMILVIPDMRRADVSFTYTLNEIYDYIDTLDISMIALLGSDDKGVEIWRDLSMAEYPCYTADDTALKTLVRGDMAIVVLDDGIITSKLNMASMDMSVLENHPTQDDFFNEFVDSRHDDFSIINLIFGVTLLLLFIFQGLIIGIRAKLRAAYAKKHAKIS